MLQNSKHVLFDEQAKLKLENPEMSLEGWKAHIHDRKCTFRVEKIVTGKTALKNKRYGYKVSTQDPLWPDCEPAVRSRADFHLLQMQLEKRFPNAVVPRIYKKEVDNLYMMEIYLSEVSLNPFFRMDVSFSDFLNGKFKEYKQTKKNDRKHSQGTLRWLQQVTEYGEIETSDDFVRGLKGDLDQLERSQKNLIKALDINAKTLNDLQTAAATVGTGLGEYLAVELSSENRPEGSASGLAPGRLKGLLEKLIQLNQDHQAGLKQAFDGGSLDRLTIQPIILELRNLTALKKVIEILVAAKKDFDVSKGSFDSIANEDPQKEKAKEALMYKDIYYYKQRRALGYELERFRTFRTIRFQEFFHAYTKFNLRGANRITEEWSRSNLKLDPNEEAEFFKMDAIYAGQIENPLGKQGRARAGSVNQTSKRTMNRAPVDLKSLMVINDVHPRMGSKYVKLTKGELITGHLSDNGNYFVTTSAGIKGFVKPVNVEIHTGGPAQRPQQPKTPSMPPSFGNQSSQSGFNVPTYSNIDEGMEPDDWSVSSEGGANELSESKKTAFTASVPVPPSLPPGLSFNPMSPPMAIPMPQKTATPPMTIPAAVPPSAKPPMSNAPVPPMSKPGPVPPSSKPAENTFKPPAFNGNSGGNDFTPKGMNAPGQPSSMPNFGAPGPMPQLPTFGNAAVPSFGNPGVGNNGPTPSFTPNQSAPQPPMSKPGPVPPAAKPAGNNKAAAAPKLGGGMPARPGGGGPSFLADIGKGNNLKKLNKVPDSEKSKEIGGEKGKGVGGVVVEGGGARAPGGGGGGARPPPMMGGGGNVMGELAMKLNKRR